MSLHNKALQPIGGFAPEKLDRKDCFPRSAKELGIIVFPLQMADT